jgi:hypothetical protein
MSSAAKAFSIGMIWFMAAGAMTVVFAHALYVPWTAMIAITALITAAAAFATNAVAKAGSPA